MTFLARMAQFNRDLRDAGILSKDQYIRYSKNCDGNKFLWIDDNILRFESIRSKIEDAIIDEFEKDFDVRKTSKNSILYTLEERKK